MTSMLVFGADRRGESSAHPLLQAQGGLFCLSTAFFLCRSVRAMTETE